MSVIWILVIVIAVILFGIIAIFNRLVGLKNRTDEAWSDIDVQLKRRYDLIPNLIETVKGYAKHEKELFEKVTQARTEAMKSKGLTDKAKAENQITEALKSVFAVAENYPNLKANENFVELQKEVTDTEDKIQASRRFYNANVRDLNIAIESFPSNVVAGVFGYKKRELFELEDVGERKNVEVKF
ncbi:MAG: LemA family protein [Patescibacteria group bacterium]|jgi:LemA protein|nr:LemA family protein [Patescibacteria group bacterium]